MTFQLENGDFELPVVPRISSSDPIVSFLPLVPGWQTTDSVFEFWQSGVSGIGSYSGNQFAEANANFAGSLSQDFYQIPTDEITLTFAHRGRLGNDTIQVLIGPKGAETEVIGEFTTSSTNWVKYSIKYVVPEGRRNITLVFRAVKSAGGLISKGNFLDNVGILPTRCIGNNNQKESSKSLFFCLTDTQQNFTLIYSCGACGLCSQIQRAIH